MDLLETVQRDFTGRLTADEYFADIAIIEQRAAYTEDELQNLLKTVRGRAGKVGACVIVHPTAAGVQDPNLPGPRTGLIQQLTVLVHPTINRSSQGTGKSVTEIAIRALQLFHHFIPFGVTQVFIGAPDAIVPDDSFRGLDARTVTLTSAAQLARTPKVSLPRIETTSETAPATVTLSCDTSGAVLHYTVDGTYPSPANEAALLYSAPFAAATARTIRTAATKSGLQQSDVAQLCIS